MNRLTSWWSKRRKTRSEGEIPSFMTKGQRVYCQIQDCPWNSGGDEDPRVTWIKLSRHVREHNDA